MDSLRSGSPFEEPAVLLRSRDPALTASKAGALWKPGAAGEGRIEVPVLNDIISVSFPEIQVQAPGRLDSFSFKLLTLIYLANSSGEAPAGHWISYRELPSGRTYEPVLERSVCEPLARAFGSDPDLFSLACGQWGGQPEEFGDRAFSFKPFPLVLVCFVLWRSDAEFPSRVQVLFDSACRSHFNAFELRMVAQEISERLIKSGQSG